MLSCDEILAAIESPLSPESKLSVIPKPRREEILSRGAASVDLRLGRWFRSFKQTRTPYFSLATDSDEEDGDSKMVFKTRQHFVPFGDKFVLHPGAFVLGVTLEWLKLPGMLSGYVTGKSSLGRHGLVIETAAGIHPGFSGCLTLELANVGEIPLEIRPGMKICQIFFHRTTPCETETPGTISGRRKPHLPSPRLDPIFKKIMDSRPEAGG